MTINIPEGQRVRIRRYEGGNYPAHAAVKVNGEYRNKRNIYKQDALDGINDTSFILMEPVTFNVSSSYTELMGSNSSSGVELPQYLGGQVLDAVGLGTAAGIVTGVTEYSGFQRWSGTGLIETELSVGLIAKEDAYNDVVLPMLNLIKLTVPTVNVEKDNWIGKARTLRLPGPSIVKAMRDIFGKDVSDKHYTSSDTEFTICVGNLVFDHAVITSVTPTIMPDTDTNGYPLSVFLKIKFKVTRIPNNEMIDDIFNGWTSYGIADSMDENG